MPILAVIDALNAENASLKDKALRTMAEMENLRRRTEKEIADARIYAVTSFARDLLTVADNMRRGLESVSPESHATADGPLKALIEGVELTERERNRIFNLGYYTWVEQQGTPFELFEERRHQSFWEGLRRFVPVWDDMIRDFNARKDNPTRWNLHVYKGEDSVDALLRDKKADIAILAGRNDTKIRNIERVNRAGIRIFADKPWATDEKSLGFLKDAMRPERPLTADIMTERFEITTVLQKI